MNGNVAISVTPADSPAVMRCGCSAPLLERADFSDTEQRAVQIQDEIYRTRTEPAVRNPDASTALTHSRPPQLDLGSAMQGILAGELEPRETLQQLEDAFNQNLDDVIAAAQADGLEVSREDWVFPNWDPSAHYLPEDYEQL